MRPAAPAFCMCQWRECLAVSGGGGFHVCACTEGSKRIAAGDQRTTQQLEIIDKWLLSRSCEVLAYSPAQEQDEDHRRGDPDGPVQVRVPLEHVEEVGAREQRGPAPLQDGRGVDVEELRVEVYRPQVPLARARGRRRQGEARGAGGLAVRRRRLGEVGVVEFEVVLEVGVAEVALVMMGWAS